MLIPGGGGGAFWGCLWPPAAVTVCYSHALWDVIIFVLWPIHGFDSADKPPSQPCFRQLPPVTTAAIICSVWHRYWRKQLAQTLVLKADDAVLISAAHG